jgi:hypothetical protein
MPKLQRLHYLLIGLGAALLLGMYDMGDTLLPHGGAGTGSIGSVAIPFGAGYFNNLNVSGVPTGTTSGPLTLSVTTAGTDTGNCVSAACLTIDYARSQVPLNIQDPVTINVGAGTYTAGAYINGFHVSVNTARKPSSQTTGPYLKIAGTYGNDAPATGLQTGTVASATQGNTGLLGSGDPAVWGTFTVTGAGWTVNDLAGRLVSFTGGTCAAGVKVRVNTNTATVATIAGVFPTLPDNTCTFAFVVPTSIINNVLPRVPGVNGNAYSTTNACAFYVTNNSAAGVASGGNSDSSAATPAPIYDPQISVEGFSFQFSNSNNSVVCGTDLSYWAARFNNISYSSTGQVFAFALHGKGTTWIESNRTSTSSTASIVLVRTTGANLGLESDLGGGCVFGNYMTLAGSSLLDGLGYVGGNWIFAQNSVNGVGGGNGIGLTLLSKGASYILTSGNLFASLFDGLEVSSTSGSPASLIQMDGDTFNTMSNSVINVAGPVNVYLSGTTLHGSGNVNGFIPGRGSRIIITNGNPGFTTTSHDIFQNDNGQFMSFSTLESVCPEVWINTLGTTVWQQGCGSNGVSTMFGSTPIIPSFTNANLPTCPVGGSGLANLEAYDTTNSCITRCDGVSWKCVDAPFTATPFTTPGTSVPSTVGCTDTAETVTGATVDKPCNVSPHSAPTSAGGWGAQCYASASGTIQLHLCCITATCTANSVTWTLKQ